MKVNELIQRLQDLDPEREIMILDGFNGGGYPRTINLGPLEDTITPEHDSDCADCEDRAGEVVYVMGYGCY